MRKKIVVKVSLGRRPGKDQRKSFYRTNKIAAAIVGCHLDALYVEK